MKPAPPPQFESVREWDDPFLALWPHRYDYLWAEHPNPIKSPNWQTESRYPLSDRLINQGAYLYGVRFGDFTNYFVLDIDRESLYHPTRDRLAWKRIMAALEPLGWVRAIAITSSYRGGIHLYFPFEQPQKTWEIGLAVAALLENAGFKLAPGQLEVFPNRKPYSTTGEPSLYNGHRLPLQNGSYLLNDDMQPIWGDKQTFVQQWRLAQAQNTIDAPALTRIIRTARRQQFRISGKANKFLNDLNAEIEQGWTGNGQTNHLLGRIAMRSYIFGHVLYAEAPLGGKDLVQDIMAIAQSLPGYEEWCQHQHEIEKRAQEWGDCVEQSRYFPYSKNKSPTQSEETLTDPLKPSWNQSQQSDARTRIQQAIVDLLEKEVFPKGITKRFEAIVGYGISGTTLYRHSDLWHPAHLQNEIIGDRHGGSASDCLIAASDADNPTNLLGENGCNTLPGGGSSDPPDRELAATGCNTLPGAALSDSEPRNMTPEEGIAHIKGILARIQQQRQAEKLERQTKNLLSLPLDLPLNVDRSTKT